VHQQAASREGLEIRRKGRDVMTMGIAGLGEASQKVLEYRPFAA